MNLSDSVPSLEQAIVQTSTVTKDTTKQEHDPPARLLVRKGNLITINPIPTRREARKLAKLINTIFENNVGDYIERIAELANIGIDKLQINEHEDVRALWADGDETLVVDLPLLGNLEDYPFFQTRTTIAICIGKASTKVWSRISLPVGDTLAQNNIPVSEVKQTVPIFRDIVETSIKWLTDEFNNQFDDYINKPDFLEWGAIEISAVGVNDIAISDCFRHIRDNERQIEDVFKDKDINERLTTYFRLLFDIPNSIEEYSQQLEPKKHLWFKAPIWVKVKNGYIVPRDVIYLMMSRGKWAQAIGLSFDDSLYGDLLIRSGAVAAGIIGHWL